MSVLKLLGFNESENLFEFNLKYLCCVGLWPNENWSNKKLKLYKVYEITLHIISIIFIVITGIGLYLCRDYDATLFLANLDKAFVAYTFVFKIFFFVIKRKRLEKLIMEIQFSGDTLPVKRKREMAYHVVGITILSSIIVSSFSFLAEIKGEMTVEAWMPFDPKKNVKNLTLANQIVAITFVVPCLYRAFSIQGIVCSIVMYLCDQLIELQNKLRSLYYSVDNDRIMRQELNMIIKKHIRLMGYAKTLNNIFQELFLIQNLAVTFEICLNAVTVGKIGLENITMLVTFLAFLCNALFNAYIMCYLGNELIIQSTGVSHAAYDTDWTSWPLDLQKDVLFIIRAAQNPFVLSGAGLLVMCMQTYAQALYNGYTLFALVNDKVD